ncbi:MAG: phosphatidylcholine/phosphatidylserine synthase [Candidatus Marinimicrobia bacterium]|nr:phosphatidylcholine/phosphatidylserine synthase [Candidatus Neomarinimicrobiota bacterium]MCH7762906.1 phosphatidylcholine/phosphatidylserine synthase [Candidatus Neomarinimicrobiota bacterium]
MNKQKYKKRNFIPNLITLLNMFLGFMGIVMMILGDPIRGGWLILFAGLCDVADGKLARMLGIPSRFGVEYDSFADTISFCAAPSLLIYTVYVEGLPPLLGGIIAFTPLMFGTIRLAKFNILQDEDPKSFFTGLPTPVNAIVIVSYMLFNHQVFGEMGDPRIALPMIVALGFMMVSPIRFSKFPLLSFKKGKSNSMRLLGVLVIIASAIIWRGIVLFPLMTFYILWSTIKWMIDHDRFEEEMPIVK